MRSLMAVALGISFFATPLFSLVQQHPRRHEHYSVYHAHYRQQQQRVFGQHKAVLDDNIQDGNTNNSAQKMNHKNNNKATKQKRMDFFGGQLEFTWHDQIGSILPEAWDACCGCAPSSPFLEHAWLLALEESKCASSETGWIPRHLTIQISPNNNIHSEEEEKPTQSATRRNSIDGCVPIYTKLHSYGEFIFDDAWADAARRNNLDVNYYPKLLVGIPFTPVTCSKFLWHSDVYDKYNDHQIQELNRIVGSFLKETVSQSNSDPKEGQEDEKDEDHSTTEWSSVHVNFCTDEEATALAGPLFNDGTSLNAAIATNCDNNNNSANNDNNNKAKSVGGGGDAATTSNGFDPSLLESVLLKLHQQRDNNDRNKHYDYLRRTSLQYHWINRNPRQNAGGQKFESFDDYLACFRSKRRIAIRRERAIARKNSDSQGIRIDVIVGTDILKVDGLVERMFELYLSTVEKQLYWGRQYLTLEFFQRLCFHSSFIHNLCFMCVRNVSATEGNSEHDDDHSDGDVLSGMRAEDVFAGTLNAIKDGVFYGRYWGCLPGHEVKNLHFETCYWSAIEYCIVNGLDRMEPGAGGADYKWARGFDPQIIHSVHFICNPWLRRAVSQFVDSETEYNLVLREQLLLQSALMGKRDHSINSKNTK